LLALLSLNLGQTCLELEEIEDAEQNLRQAASTMRELGERLYEAEALTYLGAVSRLSARPGTSHENLCRAASSAVEIDNQVLESLVLLQTGLTYMAEGHLGEALTSIHFAAALFHRLGDVDQEAIAWDAAAQAYLQSGRPQEAVAFGQRAAAVHREHGNAWWLAVSLEHLAAALDRADRLEESREARAEAVALLNRFPDPPAVVRRTRLVALLRGPLLAELASYTTGLPPPGEQYCPALATASTSRLSNRSQ
jgi:tetratricopeptide (TPR) repeat protein